MHQQRIRPRKAAADLRALGAAIRETRARRGLSQDRLAVKAGLGPKYIGVVERGEVSPTFRTLVLLAAGLAIPLSDLIRVYERNADEQVWTAVRKT